MSAMASQINSLTIVYSTVYSGADQRKHQSSASLAFVREIHRWPVNSPHKGPVTRKMFHLMTSSWMPGGGGGGGPVASSTPNSINLYFWKPHGVLNMNLLCKHESFRSHSLFRAIFKISAMMKFLESQKKEFPHLSSNHHGYVKFATECMFSSVTNRMKLLKMFDHQLRSQHTRWPPLLNYVKMSVSQYNKKLKIKIFTTQVLFGLRLQYLPLHVCVWG